MYAVDGISGSVTSNCSAVIAARARLCWKCMLSAHRVCVLWNSSLFTVCKIFVCFCVCLTFVKFYCSPVTCQLPILSVSFSSQATSFWLFHTTYLHIQWWWKLLYTHLQYRRLVATHRHTGWHIPRQATFWNLKVCCYTFSLNSHKIMLHENVSVLCVWLCPYVCMCTCSVPYLL